MINEISSSRCPQHVIAVAAIQSTAWWLPYNRLVQPYYSLRFRQQVNTVASWSVYRRRSSRAEKETWHSSSAAVDKSPRLSRLLGSKLIACRRNTVHVNVTSTSHCYSQLQLVNWVIIRDSRQVPHPTSVMRYCVSGALKRGNNWQVQHDRCAMSFL